MCHGRAPNIPVEPRMSPGCKKGIISPGSHGTTHGLLPDLPDYPRTTHGLDTERHGWATDYDLPRIAPDVLKFLKHPGDTKDDHGSPRIAKDQPRIPRDELGNCQGSPRIARDRSSGAIRRPIRGSVTGALGTWLFAGTGSGNAWELPCVSPESAAGPSWL